MTNRIEGHLVSLTDFIASGRDVPDLSVLFPDDMEHVCGEQPGRVYHGDLYIVDFKGLPIYDEQPEAGRWCLVLGNQEYVSNDLGELESLLYEFGCDEGHMDRPIQKEADVVKTVEDSASESIHLHARLREAEAKLSMCVDFAQKAQRGVHAANLNLDYAQKTLKQANEEQTEALKAANAIVMELATLAMKNA